MIDIASLPVVLLNGRSWLRSGDAAKAIGRSRQWVHVLSTKGRLETCQMSKRITLVSVESIERFLRTQ